ncbi:hypothetical protein ACK8GE_04250 [Micromonosporaceae bacterium DT194]|uniref:hypothetical protein n=1 Tax=Melissospora conviva TaxID=3388432 RepID=UPI003C239426
MATGTHWLYQWIDEFDISESRPAREIVKYPGAVNRLYEIAKSGSNTKSGSADRLVVGGALIAGPGMDTGVTMCSMPACRIRVADQEFGQLLHYFDYFVMQGPDPKNYLSLFEQKRVRDWLSILLRRLDSDVRYLLHLRAIGLTDYIIFANKPEIEIDDVFPARLHQVGLGHLIDVREIEKIAKDISREGGIKVAQLGARRWSVELVHPLFEGTLGRTIERKTRPNKIEVAARIITGHVLDLLADVAAAEEFSAPLASLVQPRFFESARSTTTLSVDQVALNLQIPVLLGLETRDIVSLRESEYEHFERFRAALAESIQLTIEKHESDTPERIANLVWRDKIEPAIADIDSKIKSSGKSLALKAAAGLTVGAATTAFGALAALPFVVTTGVAAAATPLIQAYKFFDDRQAIELSDMYFLWKARRHGHN